MNRLKEIKELKALAEELQLENREIIRKYKITELASIYNGIGPDSFPEWLRGLISALHPSLAVVAFIHDIDPSLAVVAFIHDIEWHESDGSKEKFTESNNRFKINGYTVAKANYSWWNPLRYIVMNHARRFGNICQLFGWAAWCSPCECAVCGVPHVSVPCAERKEVKSENRIPCVHDVCSRASSDRMRSQRHSVWGRHRL